MNSKPIIIIVAVVVLGIFGWFALKQNQNETPPAPAKPTTTTPTPPAKVAPDTEPPKGKYDEALSKIELTEEEAAAKPVDVNDANWLATVFFHRANVKEKNGNVEFFGKVVDQDGQPIEGATIMATSRQYVESLKEQVAHGGGKVDTKKIELKTDADGLFKVSGYRARNLRFESVEKTGYTSSSKLPGGFTFSPSYSTQHQPDAAEPVIFPMWKQGTTEPIVKKHWQKRVVPDGRIYSFDLRNNRVIEGEEAGDLRIRVTADYNSTTGTTNYPWTIEIEAPGGGIVATDDPYPYRAPESGYESRFSWNSTNPTGKWTRDLTRTIYIKGRGGEFYASAKLSVKVFHTNSASITMDTLVNPSGSPNLEYDPEKEIKS